MSVLICILVANGAVQMFLIIKLVIRTNRLHEELNEEKRQRGLDVADVLRAIRSQEKDFRAHNHAAEFAAAACSIGDVRDLLNRTIVGAKQDWDRLASVIHRLTERVCRAEEQQKGVDSNYLAIAHALEDEARERKKVGALLDQTIAAAREAVTEETGERLALERRLRNLEVLVQIAPKAARKRTPRKAATGPPVAR